MGDFFIFFLEGLKRVFVHSGRTHSETLGWERFETYKQTLAVMWTAFIKPETSVRRTVVLTLVLLSSVRGAAQYGDEDRNMCHY